MTSSTPRYLTIRLSILVFIGFVVLGAWSPILSKHATNLGFSAEQIAWASATNAIGHFIAPLIWGQIADRWLATERCISLCALASCLGLWLLANLTQAWAVILVLIAVWVFLIPALGLISAIIFRQLEHPDRDFGMIRTWGTIGWVVAGWGLSAWWWARGATTPDYADSMRLGALAALVLAAYALTLPHTPPQPKLAEAAGARPWWLRLVDAPLEALQLFRDRSFAVYIVCMFLGHLTMPFTMQLNPLLLGRSVDSSDLPMYLTVAQSLEIVMLATLPYWLTRLGTKALMVVGSSAWTFGLAALGIGTPFALLLVALASHGIFIVGFFVAGQVFVNRQATHRIRASAQALLLLIVGCGQLLGHLLVGWIRDASADNFRLAYWVAAGLSTVLLITFTAGFRPAPVETLAANGQRKLAG